MKKSIVALCILAGIFQAVPANAVEMEKLYSGIRPLGMGNAFAAVADDENAAFYNPAGLTYIEDGRLELINPKIEISTSVLDFQKDAGNINTGDTTAAVNMMRKYIGKHQHLGVSVFPNYTGPDFEIGVLGKLGLDAEVNSPSYPTLLADLKTDAGLILALGHSFMDDSLRAGVTLKYIQRKRFYKAFTAVDIANSSTTYNFNDNVKTASKFGADVGFTYQIDDADWKPRVALAVQNIGNMDFGDYQYNPASPSVPNVYKQQINLGGSVTRDVGIGKTIIAIDYNDIAGNVGTDNDKAKRLHIGGELKFAYILALRAGFNQGYLSYGVGLNFRLIKIDYAYYKEEVGAYAGQREDARHAVELSIGF